MLNRIKKHIKEISNFNSKDPKKIQSFKIKYLGKKGIITSLFSDFKGLSPDKKKETGQMINLLKLDVESKLNLLIDKDSVSLDKEKTDLTKPGYFFPIGSAHPLSIIKNQIIDIFSNLGFSISEGPEIEDDWHNFTALNIPKEHPARDMQDTFFLTKDLNYLLRTHTSSVQVKYMEKNQPPIKTISPGRVFRNEAISARAHCIFHQVEGLYIDSNVSFCDLKRTLFSFAKEMFGPEINVRFRPSYFPFTEPSAEMDISCNICKEIGCPVCKNSGWVEILGCGMVDPKVLKNCKIDPIKYTGFAFGMGIERITMLKYQIKDLRLFFENDISFLEQFKTTL